MAAEADILRMFDTVDRELGPVTAMIPLKPCAT